MSDQRPLRTGEVARVWPLAGVYGVLWLMLALVPLSWAFGVTDHWHPPAMPQPVIYGVIALVFLLLTWRAFSIGVRVTAQGVTIRNVTFSRRVPWSEIERFEEGNADRWPGQFTCLVRRRDGSTVVAACLGPPLDVDRWTKRAIARLNATLEERRRETATASAAPEPA